MPATEKTARDPKLLHKVFAVTGVLMLLATFWMLADDHARSWKDYQRRWVGIENRNTAWRAAELEQTVLAGLEDLEQQLADTRVTMPNEKRLSQFAELLDDESEQVELNEDYQDLLAAFNAYQETQQGEAGEGAVVQAIEQIEEARDDLLETMREIIADAKFREDTLLRERKFASADLDAKRSQVGLAVSANKPSEEIEELQSVADQQQQVVETLNLEYQAAAAKRKQLQNILDEILAPEAAVQKEVDKLKLQLSTLENAIEERASFYFTDDFPYVGKRWLELPILDAFNSPRKIDNLWTDNLTIDYNFRRVRRFDRCTTCHQGIDKSNGYVPEHDLAVVLPTPETAPGGEQVTVESVYGMLLGDISLTGDNEVTVHSVAPYSLAAEAHVENDHTAPPELPPAAIRRHVANPFDHTKDDDTPPGVQLGDRIVAINGNKVTSLAQAKRLLLDSVTWGQPFELTVRRGVPHPFTAHPRLDLFLSSLSPHPTSRFGCTSCHEGQGNATEFKWASHAPNNLTERSEWMSEYGWFNNHHWIYPMYPERFAESGCLKCHHNVTELTASEEFPNPPAPKVTQGYHLILNYGCFGCHEINGYNGDERIGPDMRLEPNYFAAAQALQGDANYDAVPEGVQDLIERVIQNPAHNQARHELVEWLDHDLKRDTPTFTADASRLKDVLEDVENPGQLRKVGPSLRYVGSKIDKEFMYDWIANPRDFRPTTRMPRFFGLNAHLVGSEAMHTAQKFEPIEILAMSTYLLDRSQEFEFLPAAESVTPTEEAEQIARGKQLFQVRGCLACHDHDDFPDVSDYRPDNEIAPGPDLSGVGSKFAPERNKHGRDWLYSWIKNPSRYNPRTIMPDMKLDLVHHSAAAPAGELPEGEQPAAEDAAAGDVAEPIVQDSVTDPIADIVAYLMSTKREDWEAKQKIALPLRSEEQQALEELAVEFLEGAYYAEEARLYYRRGIAYTDEEVHSVKGAEVEMLVPEDGEISDRQRLLYVGRKAIGKYGCYACHDIPGFEDAKPIGAALADWGRKDPSRLAFEHIGEYLAHGHAHGHTGGHPEGAVQEDLAEHGPGAMPHEHSVEHAVDPEVFAYEHGGEGLDPYYHHALEGHERASFIYQKLREPRSYDYHKAADKGYNEWLRMPLFPFNHQQREEVMTFVLGLVADPPAPEFVYQPNERELALIEGKQVLEKYNCTGCHMLSVEQWNLAYEPGTFLPSPEAATYPFMTEEFTAEQLLETTAESPQLTEAGLLRAHLVGLPAIDNRDALPIVEVMEDGDLYPLEENVEYLPNQLYYQFQLWEAMPLDGNSYQVGSVLQVPGTMITERRAPYGGYLTRYLLPRVIELEKQVNPNANGSEAYGWLPPPLVNQGNKTQGDWLFSFLLDPHQIRPAVYLQMPKFNMSPDEARKLVNYFAARDNANFPYEYSESQAQSHLARMEQRYEQKLAEANGPAPAEGSGTANGYASDTTRLDAAMDIVVNKNYCVTCHLVGEFEPAGSERAKAPNLAEVYKRLRYDYVFPWIANPKRILPYTSMPVNIPYDPNAPHQGGIPQDIYHGTSVEQVRALSDLLLNYDKYAKAKTAINPLVEAAKGMGTPPEDQPPVVPTDPPGPAAEPPATEEAPPADTPADEAPSGEPPVDEIPAEEATAASPAESN